MNSTKNNVLSPLKDIQEEYGLDADEVRAAIRGSGVGDKPISSLSLLDLSYLDQSCRVAAENREDADPTAVGAQIAEGLAHGVAKLIQVRDGFTDRVRRGAR